MLEPQSAGVALRWTRACVLALVVLAFSGLAHVTAGGKVPGLLGLALLTALATAVLASMLGRPASRLKIMTLLAGGQALLHGVFTALSGHGGSAAATHTHSHSVAVGAGASPSTAGSLSEALGMDQLMAAAPTGADPVAAWIAHLEADLTAANGLMTLAHLAAAALIGAWLAVGERAIWLLVTLCAAPAIRATVRAQLAVTRAANTRDLIAELLDAQAPLVRIEPRAPSTTARRLTDTVVRRGPPPAHCPA